MDMYICIAVGSKSGGNGRKDSYETDHMRYNYEMCHPQGRCIHKSRWMDTLSISNGRNYSYETGHMRLIEKCINHAG